MPFITDNAIDALLSYVKDNCADLHVCTSEPATYGAVVAASLGSVAIDATDVTLAAGDTNGRKFTVGAQAVPVTSDGTIAAYAITDGVSELLFTTTATVSRAVLNGDTANVAAFDHEVADAVAE